MATAEGTNKIIDLNEVANTENYRGPVEPASPTPDNFGHAHWVTCVSNGTYVNFSNKVCNAGDELRYDAVNLVWNRADGNPNLGVLSGDLDADGNKIINLGKATEAGNTVEFEQWEEKNVDWTPIKNLFDKTRHIVDGKYVSTGTPFTIGTAADWGVTDFIEIKENTDYYVQTPNYGGEAIIIYDASKTYLGQSAVAQFTSPAGATYVRFTLYNPAGKVAFGDGSATQIAEGTVATTAEKYKLIPKKYGNFVSVNRLYNALVESQADDPSAVIS